MDFSHCSLQGQIETCEQWNVCRNFAKVSERHLLEYDNKHAIWDLQQNIGEEIWD